ncbi:uncharacterized protein LOC128990876 [Macrosteles quadrilineatus]|uniref:uncharacterized protein LOC128990876 n=1 Tax=Macrosteles quadrilineatus TaxID=74068 RepID=UPI0023E0AB20|nr:uncharacterized protein LOC128990876 [Macrosteles quadrilineatus]
MDFVYSSLLLLIRVLALAAAPIRVPSFDDDQDFGFKKEIIKTINDDPYLIDKFADNPPVDITRYDSTANHDSPESNGEHYRTEHGDGFDVLEIIRSQGELKSNHITDVGKNTYTKGNNIKDDLVTENLKEITVRGNQEKRLGFEDAKIISIFTYLEGKKPSLQKPGTQQQPSKPATGQENKPPVDQASKPSTGQANKPNIGQHHRPGHRPVHCGHRPGHCGHRPGHCGHKYKPWCGKKKPNHENERLYTEEEVMSLLTLLSRLKKNKH